MKKYITEQSMEQSDYYLKNLENTINKISLMQFEMLTDRYVNQIAIGYDSHDSYARIQAILSVQSRLQSIRNMSPIVEDIKLYAPKENIALSAVTGLGEFDSQMINEKNLRHPSQIVYSSGKLYMTISDLSPITIDPMKETPTVILEIELSIPEIENDLVQSNIRTYSGIVILRIGDQYQFTYDSNGENQFEPFLKSETDGNSNQLQLSEERNISGKSYMVIQVAASKDNKLLLQQFIPKDVIFKQVHRRAIWFWIFTVLTFVAICFFLAYNNNTIHRPLLQMVRAFKRVEEGNLETVIHHNHQDEYRYLYEQFNWTVDSLRHLIDEQYRKTILLQTAELKQLQSQINPHFLYNSLFIVVRMIKLEKLEEAVIFVDQLAQYFRFVTKNSSDLVVLENEVQHAKNYANIQQTRFNNRVTLIFGEVPERFKPRQVPRLIIQPLIENAYIHGMEDKLDKGVLSITFELNDQQLKICVEDNGDRAEDNLARIHACLNTDDSFDKETTAIRNVDRRLKSVFGPNSGLNASLSRRYGGICICIIIEGEDLSHA
ncbi:sensor histidine kinase [Paenibacillus oryzisoli]|uniref:HAMP domain-containing protein n=1 Tax=Paenibacillus oryzisoli TaxID=1850517 RepID=A0A198AA43_9BACL|nr:histidine kinase [Paenibacillus oryzisoli]OAS18027.1 hypothetical protein A8708_28890 [Paenibacillus oryzisoli]